MHIHYLLCMKEKKQTNSERILASLLESSKTTAELAKELGYVNKQGTPRYNIIERNLRKLVDNGYITGEKKKVTKVGSTPTLYSIVFDISILKNMMEDYPHLVTQMQKSTLVRDKIVREFLYFISDFRIRKKFNKSNGCKDGENDNDIVEFEYLRDFIIYRCFKHVCVPRDEVNKYMTFAEGPFNERLDIFEDDLRQKLQLSPEFFKQFLINDKRVLLNNIFELIEISDEYIYSESQILYTYDGLAIAYPIGFFNFGISLPATAPGIRSAPTSGSASSASTACCATATARCGSDRSTTCGRWRAATAGSAI
jgi:predicted transcriptional regulator